MNKALSGLWLVVNAVLVFVGVMNVMLYVIPQSPVSILVSSIVALAIGLFSIAMHFNRIYKLKLRNDRS